jgi:hypothetical protein
MSWWIDFGLGVLLLALVPFALAAYGGQIAADTIPDSRKRRRVKLTFWGLGLAGLLVAMAYQDRSMKTDTRRQAQTQDFQKQVTARLDKITSQPASKDQQREASKLKALVKAANPASPRLGTGPDAYKQIDDTQLGQWTMEEADKIAEMATAAMTSNPNVPISANARVWRFTNDFNDCCAQDVKDLRSEVLRRLGPPAKDTDEIQAWTALFPAMKYPAAPQDVNPGMVTYYAPYLRRLGLRLKRRASPRSVPMALQFSEQQFPPEKPGYSHIVVSIQTKKELSAGYIVVQFSGQPYSVGCDFQDSKLALGAEVPTDNPTVAELLKAPTNYVLQIGKTPFTPSKPVHVEVRAANLIHVSTVTFYDE